MASANSPQIDMYQATSDGSAGQMAIDPVRNRAFVTNSCSRALEGCNLSVLSAR